MSCPHGVWHEEDCEVCTDLSRADTAVDEAAVALEIADTEIAKLKAEIERLKCCGNCDEWHPSGHRCYMGDDGTVFTDRMDSCHFTPSCWAERETP